ncbi:hypothetical protein PPACK8108_LOCUS20191 [Phakopsora pachyrhizi]|uniref:Uncharacterized protein n=1 Tax=Phakopsora pachyrhizi TaxID=170000 RepID=A0AAV0BGZ4_PHAPC|nr:hypothetical protein PPACK8108_LOCUS20191 [Phakopsora pachyrhizi]
MHHAHIVYVRLLRLPWGLNIRRFEAGSSAGVELEDATGEQIELGFYGGKKWNATYDLMRTHPIVLGVVSEARTQLRTAYLRRPSISATLGVQSAGTNTLTRGGASCEAPPVLEAQPSLAEAVLAIMPTPTPQQNMNKVDSNAELKAYAVAGRLSSAGPNESFQIKTERECCSAPLPSDYPSTEDIDLKPTVPEFKDYPEMLRGTLDSCGTTSLSVIRILNDEVIFSHMFDIFATPDHIEQYYFKKVRGSGRRKS